MGPDGKPMGIPNVPVIPPSSTIPPAPDFNVPPPSVPAPYSYSSVPSSQPYNQVREIFSIQLLKIVVLFRDDKLNSNQQVSNYWSNDQSGMMHSQPPFMKGMRPSGRLPHNMRNIDPMRGRDEKEKTPEEDTSATIGTYKLLLFHYYT